MVWERKAWDWLVVRYDVDYMQFLVLVMANIQQVLSIQVLFIQFLALKRNLAKDNLFLALAYCCILFTLTNVFVFFQISGIVILTGFSIEGGTWRLIAAYFGIYSRLLCV